MKAAIIRTLLTLAILAAVPSVAATDDFIDMSALKYSHVCRKAANIWECHTYTSGVLDGLSVRETSEHYNIPEGVTVQQVMLITLRYINRHPKHILRALEEAYPPQTARKP